jgi:hypothetical protein
MQTEQELLALADLRIARAERNLSEQARRIEELDRGGHDVRQAKALLKVMEGSLQGMREHRAAILDRLRPASSAAPRTLRPTNPRRP